MGGSVRPEDPWGVLAPATPSDPWGVLPAAAAGATARLDRPFIDALDGLTTGAPRVARQPGKFRPSPAAADPNEKARRQQRKEAEARARGAAFDAALGGAGRGAIARSVIGGLETIATAAQTFRDDLDAMTTRRRLNPDGTPVDPAMPRSTGSRNLEAARTFAREAREAAGTGTAPATFAEARQQGLEGISRYVRGAAGNALGSMAIGATAAVTTRNPYAAAVAITGQQIGETQLGLEEKAKRQQWTGEYDEFDQPIMEDVPIDAGRNRAISQGVGVLTAIPDMALQGRVLRNIGIDSRKVLGETGESLFAAGRRKLAESALGKALIRAEQRLAGTTVGSVALQGAKGGIEEAPTEFIQTLGTAGLAPALAGYDVDGKALLDEAIESGIQGGIGGVALGGGSRAGRVVVDKARNTVLDALESLEARNVRRRALADELVQPTGTPVPPMPSAAPAPSRAPTQEEAIRRADIEEALTAGGLAPDEEAALRLELAAIPEPIGPTAAPVPRETFDPATGVQPVEPETAPAGPFAGMTDEELFERVKALRNAGPDADPNTGFDLAEAEREYYSRNERRAKPRLPEDGDPMLTDDALERRFRNATDEQLEARLQSDIEQSEAMPNNRTLKRNVELTQAERARRQRAFFGITPTPEAEPVTPPTDSAPEPLPFIQFEEDAPATVEPAKMAPNKAAPEAVDDDPRTYEELVAERRRLDDAAANEEDDAVSRELYRQANEIEEKIERRLARNAAPETQRALKAMRDNSDDTETHRELMLALDRQYNQDASSDNQIRVDDARRRFESLTDTDLAEHIFGLEKIAKTLKKDERSWGFGKRILGNIRIARRERARRDGATVDDSLLDGNGKKVKPPKESKAPAEKKSSAQSEQSARIARLNAMETLDAAELKAQIDADTEELGKGRFGLRRYTDNGLLAYRRQLVAALEANTGKQSATLKKAAALVESIDADLGVRGLAVPSEKTPRISDKKVPDTPQASPAPAAGRVQRTIVGDEKIQTRYEVREAADLVASHDPFTFLPSSKYPEGVQGRDLRNDTGAQQNIIQNAQRNDPDRSLDSTSSITGGPPTVTTDGASIAGNGRLMALKRAIQEFPARYEEYRAALVDRAEEFGIDPSVVAEMKSPVLVRVIVDPAIDQNDNDVLQRLNRKSDETETKSKRGVDEAGSASAALRENPAALNHLVNTFPADETIAEYLDTTAGRDFLVKLMAGGVIPKERIGQLTRGEGATLKLTAEGKLFVQRLIVVTAMDGNAALMDTLPSAVLSKVERIAPTLIVTSEIPGWSVASRVRDALQLIADADEAGQTLDAYVLERNSQPDLSGELAPVAPEALRWAQKIVGTKPLELAKQMREYGVRAQIARDVTNENAGAMPGFERAVEEPGGALRDTMSMSQRGRITNAAGEKLLKMVPSPADTAKQAQQDFFASPEQTGDVVAYDADRAARDQSYRTAWVILFNPALRRDVAAGKPSATWLDAFSLVRGNAKMVPEEAQFRQALEKRGKDIRTSLDQGDLFGSVEAQRAFHGSPYRFTRFTTDKMGTGEGAQVYGWGLYFASKFSIAMHYFRHLGVEFQFGQNRYSPGQPGFNVLVDALQDGYDVTRAKADAELEAATTLRDRLKEADNPRSRTPRTIDALNNAQGRVRTAEQNVSVLMSAKNDAGLRRAMTSGHKARYIFPEKTKDGRSLETYFDRLAAYWQKGAIVPSYAGWDKVIDYDPASRTATVILVDRETGEPLPGERQRRHGTMPADPGIFSALKARGDISENETPGQMYEVMVPDDVDLLQWDTAIKDQDESMLSRIEPVAAMIDAEWFDQNGNYPGDMNDPGSLTGKGFYKTLSQAFEDGEINMEAVEAFDADGAIMEAYNTDQYDKAASLLLLSAGIKGIRYYDATARGDRVDGKRTENFVVFRDDDIEIVDTRFSPKRTSKDPAQIGMDFTGPPTAPAVLVVPVDPNPAPKDTAAPDAVKQMQTAAVMQNTSIGRMTDLLQRLQRYFNSLIDQSGNLVSPEAPTRLLPPQARNVTDALTDIYKGTRYLAFSLDFLHALMTNTHFSIVGQKVGSVEDLAVLLQALRDPTVETGRMIVVDANGNIIGHEMTSAGQVGTTPMQTNQMIDLSVQKVIMGSRNGLKDAVLQKYPKAAKVYFVHNHPSGSPIPSKGDGEGMLNSLRLLGDMYAGDIIINSGEYAWIPAKTPVALRQLSIKDGNDDALLKEKHTAFVRSLPGRGPGSPDPLFTPEDGPMTAIAQRSGPRMVGGEMRRNGQDIIDAALEFYRAGGETIAVVLDAMSQIRAVSALPKELAGQTSPGGLRAWSEEYMRATGGEAIIFVTDDMVSANRMAKIAKTSGEGVGVVLVDPSGEVLGEDRLTAFYPRNRNGVKVSGERAAQQAPLNNRQVNGGRTLRSRVDSFFRAAASGDWIDRLMRRQSSAVKAIVEFEPEVEPSFIKAQGADPSKADRFARVKAAITWASRLTEAIPALGRVTRDTETTLVNELLLMFRRAPAHAQRLAGDYLADVTDGLSREEVDLMTRSLVLDDLLKDLDNGVYTLEGNNSVPFFGTDANGKRLAPSQARTRIMAERAKIDAAVLARPHVVSAIANLKAKRRAIVQQLVLADMIDPAVLDDDRYYHRQVLEYARAIEAGQLRPGRSVRQRVAGFERARKGGGEFNTLFVESEFEWVAQAYEKLMLHGIQERVRQVADHAPAMRRLARDKNRNTFYRKVQPLLDDYVAGRPIPGWLEALLPDRKKNAKLLQPTLPGMAVQTGFGTKIDPLAPFRQRIGMNTAEIYNGVNNGVFAIPELAAFSGMVSALKKWMNGGQIGYFDHPQWFKFLGALSKLDTLAEQKNALAIFAAMAERDQLIKEINGEAQTTWQKEAANEGYDLWQREKGQVVYTALSITEEAVDQIMTQQRDLSIEDLNEIKAMGGPKEQWAVQPHIAQALDDPSAGLGAPGPYSPERAWVRGMGLWKYWQLYRPSRVLKYNLNNAAGDADVTFLHPGIFRYAGKALRDVAAEAKGVNKIPTSLRNELRMWQRHGAIDSGFAAAEITGVWELPELAHLADPNPLLVMRIMGAYWKNAENITRVRENVLRLAAARYFEAQIKAKGLTTFAASNPKIIRNLWETGDKADRVQVVAARLARDLIGDYQSISSGGSWMRNRLMPFFSWQEINAKRYFWSFRNIAAQPEGKTAAIAGLAGAAATRAALGAVRLGARAVTLGLKVHAFYALAQLWNRLFWPEEEEKLRRDGRGVHIIYGYDEEAQEVKWLRIESAWGAMLKLAALEDFPADIKDLREGNATIEQKLSEAAWATPKQAILAWEPVTKGIVEAVAGINLFPDPFNPRPLKEAGRDWMKSQGIGAVNDLYRKVMGEPIPPSRPGVTDAKTVGQAFTRVIDDFVGNRTDVGEAAYWMTRQRAADFMEKKKGENPARRLNEQQLALYYFKAASKWDEPEKAQEWLERYYELGGTPKGVTASIKGADPLSSVPNKNMGEFMRSLTPADRQMVRDAQKFWRDEQRKPAREARRSVSFPEVRRRMRDAEQ